MKRNKMVDELIRQDIDTIRQGLENNDIEFLERVLSGEGFVPYNLLSDETITAEYNERKEK